MCIKKLAFCVAVTKHILKYQSITAEYSTNINLKDQKSQSQTLSIYSENKTVRTVKIYHFYHGDYMLYVHGYVNTEK